ncbi:MAG: recombinase family protein [Syntrophobacteraceae bacterium]|jgi:DNA invertase Pin-like site-specific DNA recombinase
MRERIRAFGYERVSGRSQVEGYGFDRQEETILNYAKKAGYEIVHIFREEAISGTKDQEDRPAFQDMVAEILKDGVRTIIIEGLDRLAREYRIQETLLIYLASKNITLISARTGENVTDEVQADPMKKALIQIQGIFSELEKSLLVKKLRNARDRVRAEKGKCEGRKSYAERSPGLIEEIKALRRKPKGKDRMTYIQVAEELNRRGLHTIGRKPFTGQAIQNILR